MLSVNSSSFTIGSSTSYHSSLQVFLCPLVGGHLLQALLLAKTLFALEEVGPILFCQVVNRSADPDFAALPILNSITAIWRFPHRTVVGLSTCLLV